VIVRLVLPELAGAMQNAIRLSGGIGTHRAIDARQRRVWIYKEVHMVGHDHPGAEIIELQNSIGVMYGGRDPRQRPDRLSATWDR
jgi:hypothetical protein